MRQDAKLAPLFQTGPLVDCRSSDDEAATDASDWEDEPERPRRLSEEEPGIFKRRPINQPGNIQLEAGALQLGIKKLAGHVEMGTSPEANTSHPRHAVYRQGSDRAVLYEKRVRQTFIRRELGKLRLDLLWERMDKWSTLGRDKTLWDGGEKDLLLERVW